MSVARKNRVLTSVILCLVLTGIGCGNKQFKEHISTFQQSVEATSVAVGTYYTEINEFERELYLQERLLDPQQEVLVTDSTGNPTPLIGGPFGPESIKARTDAIRLLGLYGQRLAELAGTDAPTRFAAGAEVLGKNLDSLADTFSSLSDDSAPNYVGPIGAIVGVFGQMILESRRDAALKAAIEDGAPAVRKVLELLEKDLTNVIGPQRRTGTLQRLANLVTFYNTERAQMDLEERRQLLEEIRRTAARYELLVSSNPGDVIRSMSEAHEALVKYAQSNRRIENLSELVTALEEFQNRAQRIAEAVQQLRDLRKG